MVEMDPGFKKAETPNHDSALEQFLLSCRHQGYSMIHFQAPHSMFIDELPNTSFFMIGFSKAFGGAKAVRWFESHLQPLLQQIKQHGPFCNMWRDGGRGEVQAVPGILEVQTRKVFNVNAENNVAPLSDLVREA